MRKKTVRKTAQKFMAVLPAFGWSVSIRRRVRDANDEEMDVYDRFEIIAWGVTPTGVFEPITCGRDGPGLLPNGERNFNFREIR